VRLRKQLDEALSCASGFGTVWRSGTGTIFHESDAAMVATLRSCLLQRRLLPLSPILVRRSEVALSQLFRLFQYMRVWTSVLQWGRLIVRSSYLTVKNGVATLRKSKLLRTTEEPLVPRKRPRSSMACWSGSIMSLAKSCEKRCSIDSALRRQPRYSLSNPPLCYHLEHRPIQIPGLGKATAFSKSLIVD